MMLQKRSSRWTGARALVVVPLTCAALGAFARTVEVPVEDKSTQNSRTEEIFAEKSDKPVTIRVEVVDDANRPLAGVLMQEHGTQHGAATDASGRAELTIDETSSVDLLMAGYETVNLTFRNDITSMTGPGMMRTTAKSADAVSMVVSLHPEGAAVASVKIRPQRAAMMVSVRPSEKQPLYLVEGEPVGTIDDIDPQTIASIDVLKAGESTQPYVEKYGDRAENGVVLVRLKESAEPRVGSTGKTESALRILSATTVDREAGAETVSYSITSSYPETDAPKLRPLILVDGKVVPDMNDIDPQTIASINVLKGDEHTQPYVEKYGDRAKNGVVLVRLKQEASADEPLAMALQEARQRLQQGEALRSDAWDGQEVQFREAQARFNAWEEQFQVRQEQFREQQARFKEQAERFQEEQERFKASAERFQELQEQFQKQAGSTRQDA